MHREMQWHSLLHRQFFRNKLIGRCVELFEWEWNIEFYYDSEKLFLRLLLLKFFFNFMDWKFARIFVFRRTIAVMKLFFPMEHFKIVMNCP